MPIEQVDEERVATVFVCHVNNCEEETGCFIRYSNEADSLKLIPTCASCMKRIVEFLARTKSPNVVEVMRLEFSFSRREFTPFEPLRVIFTGLSRKRLNRYTKMNLALRDQWAKEVEEIEISLASSPSNGKGIRGV